MDDLVRALLSEMRGQIAMLAGDEALLARGDAAACARARRALHTLKGSAGFLGFAELEALAHSGEDLLAADSGALEDAVALGAVLGQIGKQLTVLEAGAPRAPPDLAADVPVGAACAALPAILAALGPALGKDLTLAVRHDGTRLGGGAVRTLATILLHLVRNAAAHGIEPPAERRAAGKPAAGAVTVAAWRENATLRVSVRDDGRGIDVDGIGARASALGIVDTAGLARMNSRDQIALMFRPGVTTAARLTPSAGRGIGLDVVADALERLGGTIAVTSAAGEGTVFDLAVPLGGAQSSLRRGAAPQAA